MKINLQPGQFVAILNRLTVVKAVEKWEAWASSVRAANTSAYYSTYVRAWMRDAQVKHTNVDQLTERDLDRWVNKHDGCRASTRTFRLAALRSFFFFCKAKNIRPDNPAELCTVRYKDLDHEQIEPRHKRCFTEDEYNRLVEYLKFHRQYVQSYHFWLSAVMIARHSALRLSDICRLQWQSINNTLVVHTTKRNKRVDIPITPELRAAFDTIPTGTKKWCFPKQAIVVADPKMRTMLTSQFDRILFQLKIEGVSFHSLRATKATEMNNSGLPIQSIADTLGHSSTETTQRYIVSNAPGERPPTDGVRTRP